MRRTSARTKLASAVAVTATVAALSAATTANAAQEHEPQSRTPFASPVGFGANTTGGAGGDTVTVSDADAFVRAVQSDGPLVVRVDGTIRLTGMTKVASDKTIVGVGGNGRIDGSGLNVSRVSNVIIQNLTFSNSNDDGVNVEYSTDVWIDHNDFTNPKDGAVDIKRASTNITVSWNHAYDVDKNMLLGHSDDNGGEDVGRLNVTYHHNWFDGTTQRNPRVRFGDPVHVFNNYYNDIGSYGVASTVDAGVLVEGNYFENTADPFHLGEGSSGPGRLVARDNYFTGSGQGETGGSVAPIPYGYTLDDAQDVKAIVQQGAGVGRL